MKCKSCGTELPEGASTCPECGAPVKHGTPTGLKIGLAAAAAAIVIAGFFLCFNLITGDKANTDDTALRNPGESTATPDTGDLSGTDNADGTTGAVQTDGVSYTVDAAEATDEKLDAVAATYGDHTLTNRELGFYYWRGFTSFCNNYSAYISYILDLTQPLDQQVYDSSTGQTWQEFFLESALNSFARTAALCDAAKQDGFTLDQELLDSIDELDDTFASNAAENNLGSADDYAVYVFGKGATVDGYKAYMQDYMTQYVYSSQLGAAIDPTDEEVEAYYDKNAETYAGDGVEKTDTHLVSFRHILIQPADPGMDEAGREAEAILNEWKSGEATEESFAALAGEKSTDPGSKDNGGLYTGVTEGQMVQAFNDWCFDASRKPGDTGIVQTNYGYHVMYFVEKADDGTISVRHILIQPSETTDDAAVEAAKAAAKADAEALLDSWKVGEATEESFAALAKEHSADTGSSENGGLYTGFYPGQSKQKALDDFFFDDARKPGDTAVIETDDGVHILYFVEKEPTIYWQAKARTDLINETYSNEISELVARNTLEANYDNIVIVTPAMMAG